MGPRVRPFLALFFVIKFKLNINFKKNIDSSFIYGLERKFDESRKILILFFLIYIFFNDFFLKELFWLSFDFFKRLNINFFKKY
jgi:hypothetical protein